VRSRAAVGTRQDVRARPDEVGIAALARSARSLPPATEGHRFRRLSW